MRRTLLACLALVLGFAVTAAPSFAQGVQSSTLTGSVTSSDGAPLPGVTVTITSPSLIGERATVTGVNGDYVFKNVPPGNYTVSFGLEGMKTVERTASLPLGGTARSDASMEVTAAEETIVVTGEAPSALETTTVGANFGKETIDNLPVEPYPARHRRPRPGPDQQHRGRRQHHDQRRDGVTTTPSWSTASTSRIRSSAAATTCSSRRRSRRPRFSPPASPPSTAASPAASSTPSPRAAATSSRAAFRADFDRAEWRDETPFENDRGIEREGDLNKIYTATLGGPILRDRLWFFLAGRDPGELDTPRTLRITGDSFSTVQTNERYEVKLTGTVTSTHNLQASHINNDRSDIDNVQLHADRVRLGDPERPVPERGLADRLQRASSPTTCSASCVTPRRPSSSRAWAASEHQPGRTTRRSTPTAASPAACRPLQRAVLRRHRPRRPQQ